MLAKASLKQQREESMSNEGRDKSKITRLKNQLTTGSSRRTFLQQGVVVGLAGGLLPGVPFGVAQAQTEPKPKRGGRLRIGCGDSATTDSLHPYAAGNASIHVLKGQVFNSLTEIQPDNTAAPSIAESLEVEPGAKVWNVKIRKG